MEGYLSGLSSPSVDAENDNFRGFAQIVARGADQVADVFDQQQVDIFQTPVEQAPVRSCGHPDGTSRRS